MFIWFLIKPNKWHILIFLPILFTEYVDAQIVKPKPVLKNFTVDEGLLSNEVYHIIQDSIGYIWIATASGINRFDGTNFHGYQLEDGLVDNTIYEIYADYKGRLWFISSSGKLVYFENETIRPFQFNNRITDHLPASRGPIKKSFHVDSLDNVYISLKRYGRLIIGMEGTYKKLSGIHEEGVMVLEKIDDGTTLVANPLVPQTYDIIYFDKAKNQSFRFDYNYLFGVKSPISHFFHISESDDSFIMAANGILFRVKNGQIIQKRRFGEEIIWVSIDSDNKLWVAPIEGGVHCFPYADFINESSTFILKDVQISSLFKDRENGYWFSSLANGIYYCTNINFLNYDSESSLPNNRLSTVFANRSGIYLGYETGIVSKIFDNKITNFTIGGERSSRISIRYLGIDSTSKEIWIGSSFFLHHLKNNKIVDYSQGSDSWGIYPRDMIKDSQGNFWVASVIGLLKFDGNNIVYDSHFSNEFSAVIYSLYQDLSGCIWLGCMNGLWKYQDGNFRYLGQENPLYSQQINSIKATSEGTVLLGTKGIGLIMVNGEKAFQLKQADGIASNHIKKIFVEESGIWLATNKGISWIRNTDDKFDIQNINISHGLPTNDVNNIFVRGNEVYVATTKGLTVFDKRTIELNTVKAKCKILNVKVNGIDASISHSTLNLAYDQNFITFDYIGLSFKNMGNVFYRYRLLGLDSSWVYTSSTNSIFTGLSHGKYSFEVQSQNSEGIWGDSASFSININPPFWKKIWFIILMATSFSSLLFLVYLVRIRIIRKRNQIENSINIYKQQSLRQQMNPHFIFNTLNSIQLYILEKDNISSHKYLTKFAKLIRMTLDNSQHQSTLLKNEIEALKLYLELESLRLEGKFQYSIEIEDNDLLYKEIPTLLIQPFVENSIWHGIMLKHDQEGWVKITIKNQKEIIKCIIEDNGIGRKAAQEIREKRNEEHKSLGYKITSQRIELLNTMYLDRFKIDYTDLYSPEGKAMGTRVEITIPYV